MHNICIVAHAEIRLSSRKEAKASARHVEGREFESLIAHFQLKRKASFTFYTI